MTDGSRTGSSRATGSADETAALRHALAIALDAAPWDTHDAIPRGAMRVVACGPLDVAQIAQWPEAIRDLFWLASPDCEPENIGTATKLREMRMLAMLTAPALTGGAILLLSGNRALADAVLPLVLPGIDRGFYLGPRPAAAFTMHAASAMTAAAAAVLTIEALALADRLEIARTILLDALDRSTGYSGATRTRLGELDRTVADATGGLQHYRALADSLGFPALLGRALGADARFAHRLA